MILFGHLQIVLLRQLIARFIVVQKVDFVDIDLNTGLISIEKLTKKLDEAVQLDKVPSLLIPVHLAGLAAIWKQLANYLKNMVLKS